MHGDHEKSGPKTLTILLPGGALPARVLRKVDELNARYRFEIYLSTAQNLRLYNIAEADLPAIREELAPLGIRFKGPGLFPVPRICIGNRSCKLGQIDTMALSDRILARFGAMTGVKPKFKIAIAGCPAACSNPTLTDIGIIATRQGFDIYLGGKGGPQPKTGRRVVRQADAERVLKIIGEVVEYHNRNGAAKQRLGKLLGDPAFPYREEV
jgi:sulfite reductase beta subunit-like hemoprotein